MQPHKIILAAAALLCAAACAPTLPFHRSWLVPEDVKLGRDGFTSIKTTGETLDLSPIRAQEPGAEHVTLIEARGSFLLVGDGFKHVWRLWSSGSDEASYEPVKLVPGGAGFDKPSLEASGNCALIKWTRAGVPAQAFITAKGKFDEKRCTDE